MRSEYGVACKGGTLGAGETRSSRSEGRHRIPISESHVTSLVFSERLCSLAFASFRDSRSVAIFAFTACIRFRCHPPTRCALLMHAINGRTHGRHSHGSYKYLRMEDKTEELGLSRPCMRWDFDWAPASGRSDRKAVPKEFNAHLIRHVGTAMRRFDRPRFDNRSQQRIYQGAVWESKAPSHSRHIRFS